jgi:hypothetical protein
MFKKILSILFCISIFVGCNATKTETVKTVETYFPMNANVKYSYNNSLGEQFSYDAFNTYINDKKVQRVVISPIGQYTEVIEIKDGKVTLVYSNPSHYLYEDLTNNNFDTEYVLLQEPLTVGNTWNYIEGVTSEITNTKVKIETPVGNFLAIEVTNTSIDGNIEIRYYAPNIGLIKSNTETETISYTSELIKYEEDTSIDVTENFYVYNVNEDEIVPESRVLKLTTNMNYNEIMEIEMKKYTEEQIPLLTENTKINNVLLNRAENIITIDLSNDFIEELNVGANIETNILTSISKTISSFYKIEHVNITVDGEAYESGHIESNENFS